MGRRRANPEIEPTVRPRADSDGGQIRRQPHLDELEARLLADSRKRTTHRHRRKRDVEYKELNFG